MKAIGIATMFMLSSAGAAFADDWRVAVGDRDKLFGIDIESILGDGPEKQFWSVWVRISDEPDGTAFTLQRWKVNCDTELIELLAAVTYNIEGERIQRAQIDVSPTAFLVPGSVGAGLMKAACRGEHSAMPNREILEFVRLSRLVMGTVPSDLR